MHVLLYVRADAPAVTPVCCDDPAEAPYPGPDLADENVNDSGTWRVVRIIAIEHDHRGVPRDHLARKQMSQKQLLLGRQIPVFWKLDKRRERVSQLPHFFSQRVALGNNGIENITADRFVPHGQANLVRVNDLAAIVCECLR